MVHNEEGKSLRKKKILLVNRDFQMRYTGAAVVVGIMSTVLTSVVILYPLYKFEILRIVSFLPIPVMAVMLGAVAVNVFCVGLMGIFITHKIAGPMYSMAKYFRRVEQGLWYGKLNLREGDELHYLARAINGMLEGLNGIGVKDYQKICEIQNELALEDRSDSMKLESIKKIVGRLGNDYKERLNITSDSKTGE